MKRSIAFAVALSCAGCAWVDRANPRVTRIGDARFTYDDDGYLATVHTADALATLQWQDTQLVAVSIEDGSGDEGSHTAVTYDAEDHRLARAVRDGTEWTWQRDGGGRVTALTIERGTGERATFERSYDDDGALSAITGPDGKTTFAYEDGRIVSLDDGDRELAFDYDDEHEHRLDAIGELDVKYDDDGRITRVGDQRVRYDVVEKNVRGIAIVPDALTHFVDMRGKGFDGLDPLAELRVVLPSW